MKVAIIITDELADKNILKQLMNFGFVKKNTLYDGEPVLEYENISIYQTRKISIFAEHIDVEIDADLFVFATRHKSSSMKPSLTCHAPGNWAEAEYGGEGKELCVAPANLLKQFYLSLKEKVKDDMIEVTLEATHHGPLLDKPCMFVEIGSSEKEWSNESYGRIIAESIVDVFTNYDFKCKSCFFIGGGHYNNYANKIMERTDYAVGHICPKFMLENLDETMLNQAINRCIPKSELVLLDWDGLGGEKHRLLEMLERLNIKFERVKRFLKQKEN